MLEQLTSETMMTASTISPASLSSDDYLALKIAAINDTEGKTPGERCEICKNRGYVAFAENGAIQTRKCACMTKRESMRLLQASGLAESIERLTFESYQTPKAWQESAKKTAQRYAAEPEGWFVATGGVGSGKTHLCTAICGELIAANMPVRYMQWRTDAPRLKSMVNSTEDYNAAINPLKRVRCLYIDDFLKGTVTDADINLAFEILNERYASKSLLTIISSEKSVRELLQIDEAVGSRIYERSKGSLIEIEHGNNWRLQ